jgi:hypothetical protein
MDESCCGLMVGSWCNSLSRLQLQYGCRVQVKFKSWLAVPSTLTEDEPTLRMNRDCLRPSLPRLDLSTRGASVLGFVGL